MAGDDRLLETNQAYDVQALEIMRLVLSENSNCVDVGCCRGTVLRRMLGLAPKGTHFAFEPLPQLYRGLLTRFRERPNVHLFDVALSDIAGTSRFQHVVSNPPYSGLRIRKYDRPSETVNEITVTTNLLDNLIPADVPIHFMKVDVEGGELQVFRGACATLKRAKPLIVFEHGLGAADYYGTNPNDIYELLTQCGLQISVMADWLEQRGRAALSANRFAEHFYQGRDYYFLAHP